MTTFLYALGLMLIVFAAMGVKFLILDKPMCGGCGSDPVVVDGEELSCDSCPKKDSDGSEREI